MKKDKRKIIAVMMILIAIVIITSHPGRNTLIASGEDEVTFSYPYSMTQDADGDNLQVTPSLFLGDINMTFGIPIYNCEPPVISTYFKKDQPSSTDECWYVVNFFERMAHELGTSQETIPVNDFIDITYDPQRFAYRVKTLSDGVERKFIDDVHINYEITIKEISKTLIVKATYPEKVQLGKQITIVFDIYNRFCGGSGALAIEDNAVILNQWITNKNVPISYDDCDSKFSYVITADKLGKHEVEVYSIFDLPEGSAFTSPTLSLIYEVVRDPVDENLLTTDTDRQIITNSTASIQYSDYDKLYFTDEEAEETTQMNIFPFIIIGIIVIIVAIIIMRYKK